MKHILSKIYLGGKSDIKSISFLSTYIKNNNNKIASVPAHFENPSIGELWVYSDWARWPENDFIIPLDEAENLGTKISDVFGNAN